MSFLGNLFGNGNAGNAALDSLKDNRNILSQLGTSGRALINQGEEKSRRPLVNALNSYDPYIKAGTNATNMYSNALGLNGADGNAAATGAFQAGPGYQFALDQGTQAALRGASAAGMLNSGNTLTALSGYGQGLANQEYGSWLDRLQGQSAQGLQATSGKAGIQQDLSNLYQETTGDRLGLANTIAQGRMGINSNLGSVREQQNANSTGFFGKLLGGGLSLGLKGLTGGLF